MSASAQHNPSSPTSLATGGSFAARAVTAGRVSGQFPVILGMQKIGAPVRLADGRIEQRVSVHANVAFAVRVPDEQADSVSIWTGTAETRVSDFIGTAGYHAEIVVRAATQESVNLSLEPIPASRGEQSRAIVPRSGS